MGNDNQLTLLLNCPGCKKPVIEDKVLCATCGINYQNYKLLSFPDSPLDILNVTRLGKFDVKKTRPVKVTVATDQQTLSVLKRGRDLLGKGIKTKNDMTPTQLSLLHDTRDDLKKRIEAGDVNLTIKYVRGTHTIIEKIAKI